MKQIRFVSMSRAPNATTWLFCVVYADGSEERQEQVAADGFAALAEELDAEAGAEVTA